MLLRTAAQWLARLEARHRRALLGLQWLCFAIGCASFAGLVRLPVVAIPAYVGMGLTFLRYAVWEGWLKRRLLEEPG